MCDAVVGTKKGLPVVLKGVINREKDGSNLQEISKIRDLSVSCFTLNLSTISINNTISGNLIKVPKQFRGQLSVPNILCNIQF